MTNRTASIALVAGLLAAAAFAVLRSGPTSATKEPGEPVAAQADPGPSPAAPGLPPGHPDIGAAAGGGMGAGAGAAMGAAPPLGSAPPSTGPGALTWKAPPTWTVAANPSAMRLATYHPPRAAGDTEDTDVAIIRAGGTTDANIERWLGQFKDRGKETRTTSTVRGLNVTVVDVTGTFLGGMMMPGQGPSEHPGWSLTGAIVETAGSPYFVKMTGPAATVHAARPAFDALVASLTPST